MFVSSSLSSAETQKSFSDGKNPLNDTSAGSGIQPTLGLQSPRTAAFYNEHFEKSAEERECL